MNAIDRHGLQTPSPTPLALEHQTTMDTNDTSTKQLNAQSDQSLTQSNATDSIEPLNHNPVNPHSSIRQVVHSTAHSTDNTPSDQNIADNIEHAEDEQLWEDVSDSQTKPKTRGSTKHRRHTGMQGQRRLILQPLKMGSLNSELKQAKKQINKLTALYNELQDKISTQLETSNMQLKHGLKIHIDKKLEAQEEVITTLQTKVVKLTDHNNALKSQVTDLKQELRAHKNKTTSSHKSPKDTPHKQQSPQNVQQCPDKTGAVQALQTIATTVSPTHDLSRAPPPHHVRVVEQQDNIDTASHAHIVHPSFCPKNQDEQTADQDAERAAGGVPGHELNIPPPARRLPALSSETRPDVPHHRPPEAGCARADCQ